MDRGPHSETQRRVVQSGSDFAADGIGHLAELWEGIAVRQLWTEHQAGERRPARHKSHRGGTDLSYPVRLDIGRVDDGTDLLAQFGKSLRGEFGEQGLVVGKVPVRGGVTDARLARNGAKAQLGQRFFFQDGARGIQQRIAQIAMMIGARAPSLSRTVRSVHYLPFLKASCRANKLDVSQRLPPIFSTSA